MIKNKIIEDEEVFHDNWAESINVEDIEVDIFFEACTAPENRYIIEYLGCVKDKKVLDLGCGAGEAAVYFAKKGAKVYASDLSEKMLEVGQKLAEKHDVKINTVKSTATTICFENDFFDIVYAANLLHHVDLEQALTEVQRVLKKDGLFVSWDPLIHNPIINLYRRIAREVRTETERPLRIDQLSLFKKYFNVVEYKTTWFLTLLIFVKFYLINRVDPNKERYWKKIIFEHERLNKIYTLLERIDNIILKYFPFLKKYCWNIVIIGKK